MTERPRHPASLAAHAGELTVPAATRPVAMPIYQTSVFAMPDLDTVEAIYTGQEKAYIYSRFAHPNAAALEAAYASLEGAEAALAGASGMAAIAAVLVGLLEPGAHVILDHELYGGTYALVERDLRRWGLEATYVDTADPDAVTAAIRPGATRLVFAEMLSNPTVRVADVPALAARCRRHGLLLAVDNTFATPYLARPLDWGADLVVISATKFLGGHSDLTGGLVAGRADLLDRVRQTQVNTGAVADPFAAWLCVRGIKTLHLRLQRQSENALALARWLAEQPQVAGVYYPGLPGHPSHPVARRLLSRGAGGMLSFNLGRGDAGAFFAGLRMAAFVPSLGDVTTTVSHPARTSQRALTPEQRARLGISEAMVRVSVGAEELADIIADFQGALAGLTG